jgi:sulfate-transporting ATPase
MSALEVTGVTVMLGGRTVLHDVEMRVEAGEGVGVVGPNGAGKTTLIDAVTGFVPYRGRVRLRGEPLDRLGPHERAARGLVRTFQGVETFDDLSVRENVAVSPTTTPASVAWALAVTGLRHEADRLARELPRSARTMVGLARAVATSPRVLLLDELAAGIDESVRSTLVRVITDVKTSGTAVVVIDHDLAFVEAVCPRVMNLLDGEMTPAVGPARAVVSPARRQPRHSSDGPPSLEVLRARLDGDTARTVTMQLLPREIVAVVAERDRVGTDRLVRAICGLDRLASGAILLGGRDVSDAPAHARSRLGLASVLADRGVIQGLTVEENLRLAGVSGGALREWVASWFPELATMFGRRAGLLSGGEQTLLALARALVRGPRVLVVHEVAPGLAPAYVDAVVRSLARAADLGASVVLADAHSALVAVADRRHLLDE